MKPYSQLVKHSKPQSPIVAIAGTHVIRQENLWSALIELSGEEVLQEYLLTLGLEIALQQRGLTILSDDLKEEEQLLSTFDSGVNANAMDEMLKNQGYGEVRKSELLWRNAALRKLVEDQVDINDDSVHRMFSIMHGPTFPTSIIVVSTLEEANNVISDITLGTTFADAAIRHSIDPSASNGGHVNPVSIADPIWPAPIREVISKIEINTLSTPIFIGDRWVILTVTGPPIISDVSFEDVKLRMKQLAKVSKERFLMENLAQSIIQNTDVKIIDIDVQRVSRPNTNNPK